MKTFEQQLKTLEALEPLVDAVGDEKVSSMTTFLYDRISHPDSYLVFLGETSSGKSSIINGLLGEQLLPVKAMPTTAAITEIMIADEQGPDEYYAINNDVTMEVLDKAAFSRLSEHPDKRLSRLRLKKWIGQQRLGNLRIFDTPGYGSIVKEHEEVLKNFLPNSDVIVYTVSYRMGIQEDDYQFLRFMKELIRPDVKVLLVINRCPVADRLNPSKIENIKSVVSGLLPLMPVVITIDEVKAADGGHALVECQELWSAVTDAINSPERTKTLHDTFDQFILDLYHTCDNILSSRYAEAQLGEDVLRQFRQNQRQTAEKILDAIPQLIDPAFERLEKQLPKLLDTVEGNSSNKLVEYIDGTDKFEKDETQAFLNAHMLPHTIKTETHEVQEILRVELDDLNEKVDDYIQSEMIDFSKRVNAISVQLDGNQRVALNTLLLSGTKEATRGGLQGYFVAFGGAGGANAGIANAASHLLKKAGDLVGHTFSRSTHNGVKHVLSKVGATSMKAVGVAVAVLIELAFDLYDIATWQGRLKKNTCKAIGKWKEETLPTVVKDIRKLKEENIQTIRDIADEMLAEAEPVVSSGKGMADYEMSKRIGKELFNI